MTRPQLSDPELLRYSRQILLPEWDIDAQLNLANSRVLMLGAGGLGNTAAHLLVRAGLGFLRLVDADHIEDSNLQRQILFQSGDIGLSKVEVAKRELQNINPWTNIESVPLKVDFNNLLPLMADVDLVLDGTDNFATRDVINQACVKAGIPLLSAAAIGLHGQLVFFKPGQGCYRCLFGIGTDNDARRCADSGVLATTPTVMASLQAHHALLYLGLKQAPLLNKLLVWEGMSMQQRILEFEADPNCTVCRTVKV